MSTDELIDILKRHGVALAEGLSNSELDEIEKRYCFRFPPDLRSLLGKVTPQGNKWTDWHDPDHVINRLEWPLHGICFDIENNGFWPEFWGERPAQLEDAFGVAREKISKVPLLVPIYSHRYLPAEPSEPGNPIFSVYQTDVIYYGANLADYFTNEFAPRSQHTWERPLTEFKKVAFWSWLVEDYPATTLVEEN
ncbi:MAG: SMI1/KNR4 family protein [Acidobacteria bacterium]|nr:SMI1/KNR4 family protein [Acidobacteriota bacterium]